MNSLVRIRRIIRVGRRPKLSRRALLVLDHLSDQVALAPLDLLGFDEVEAAYKCRGQVTVYSKQDLKRDLMTLHRHGLVEFIADGQIVEGPIRAPNEPEVARAKKAGEWGWLDNGMVIGEPDPYRLNNLLFERVPGKPPRGRLKATWEALPEWPTRLEDLDLPQAPLDRFQDLMALHGAGLVEVWPVGL